MGGSWCRQLPLALVKASGGTGLDPEKPEGLGVKGFALQPLKAKGLWTGLGPEDLGLSMGKGSALQTFKPRSPRPSSYEAALCLKCVCAVVFVQVFMYMQSLGLSSLAPLAYNFSTPTRPG